MGGAGGQGERLPLGAEHKVLHAGVSVPEWSNIDEGDIVLSDNSTNNTSAVKHGFAPKLSAVATQFLDGQGNWSTPTGGTPSSYSLTTFTDELAVNVIHNFGSYPNIQIIDNAGSVLIPFSIVNNTINDFTVTFDELTSGSIIATIGSPQPQSVKVVNDNYLFTLSDRIVHCASAGKTISLPTASGNVGREFVLDNGSSGNIVLSGQYGETINNLFYQSIPSDSAIHVYSEGTNWRIY